MNPTDIRSKIQAACSRLVGEMVAAFAEVFAGVTADLAVKGKHAARKKSPARVKAPAPKKAKPTKRIRRSEQAPAATGEKVLKLLAANTEGLRAEQINKHLGTSPNQISGVLKKLLGDGKIKRSGKARGTLYSPS